MNNDLRGLRIDLTGHDPGGDGKRDLSLACLKLGVMLINYRVMTMLVSDLFYIAAYYFLSGKLAGTNAAVNGLVEDYKDAVASTTFSMLMNSAVTLISVVLTLLLGHIVLGFEFDGFLRPGKDGLKKGVMFFPACMVLNIIFSELVDQFTRFMSSAGVTIPEADFSIKSPSKAAVILEMAYIVIVAPLVEEIVYRGMILGALSKYGEIPAIVFSALCFGLMHGNIPQATAAFATGLAYASLAASSHSIMPSLAVHSLNNLIVIIPTVGKALDISHVSTVVAVLDVIIAVLGVYILFTRYSYFKHKRNDVINGRGETFKVIITNPVMIVYLLILIVTMIDKIIRAN